MASNAIGSGALVLTTNSSQMTAGAKKASADTKKEMDTLGSSLRGKVTAIGSMLLGAGKVIGKGLVTGITLGAVAAPVVFAGAVSTIKDLAEQGRMALALGLSPEVFTGLSGAAEQFGIDANGIFNTFLTLGKKAQEAMTGGEATLIFRRLGIDAAAFARANPAAQLEELHKALLNIANPADRARILMQLFGDDAGRKLAPLLSKSTDELKALMGQFAATEKQMEGVRRADEAWKNISNTISKFWGTFSVTMAPVVELFATKLTAAIEQLGPKIEIMGRAMIEAFITAIHFGELLWDTFGSLIQSTIKWTDSLFGVDAAAQDVETGVSGAFKGIAYTGAYAFDVIKSGVGFVGMGVGMLILAFGELIHQFHNVASLAKALPNSIRPKMLDDFIDGIDSVSESVKKSALDIGDWGYQAFASFGKSAENVDKWFNKVDKKKIDQKLTTKAMTALPTMTPTLQSRPMDYQAVGAALIDTKESYSIQARAITNAMLNTPKENKQLDEAKKQTSILRDLLQAIVRIEIPKFESF